jgi:hypothetical protein
VGEEGSVNMGTSFSSASGDLGDLSPGMVTSWLQNGGKVRSVACGGEVADVGQRFDESHAGEPGGEK